MRDRKIFGGLIKRFGQGFSQRFGQGFGAGIRKGAAGAALLVFAGMAQEGAAQSFSFGFSTPEGVSFNVGKGVPGWQSAPLWMVPAAVPAVVAAPVYYGESPKHYRKRVKKMRKAMRRAGAGAWGSVALPGGIVVNVGAPIDYDDDWYDDDHWDDHHHHHYKHHKKHYEKHHKHHKHHHDD